MTELRSTDPAVASTLAPARGAGAGRRSPGRAPRSRSRGPLAVIAAALASFLVVLVLLTARVVSGHDPSLRASASTAAIVTRGGHTVLRTTASGRTVPVAAGAGVEAGAAQSVPLVTRSSGAVAGAGEGDE